MIEEAQTKKQIIKDLLAQYESVSQDVINLEYQKQLICKSNDIEQFVSKYNQTIQEFSNNQNDPVIDLDDDENRKFTLFFATTNSQRRLIDLVYKSEEMNSFINFKFEQNNHQFDVDYNLEQRRIQRVVAQKVNEQSKVILDEKLGFQCNSQQQIKEVINILKLETEIFSSVLLNFLEANRFI